MIAYIALIDGFGIYGNILHYGIVLSLIGSALLVFIYLACKGKLNMDEDPKFEMMESNQSNEDEGYGQSAEKK